ncbi:MAG: hypothetical protein HYX55_08445 [Chloroflexi bacterium]|nr:hypothetical protein [Chloroflexota bacterium]
MKKSASLVAVAVAVLFFDSLGSRHPCAGCGLAGYDPLQVASVVLAALAFARIALGLVRRFRGASDGRAWKMSVVLAVASVAVAAAGVLRLANASDGRAAITVGHRGLERSDPFPLAGDYQAGWSAAASTYSGCQFDVRIEAAEAPTQFRDLASVSVAVGSKQTGVVDMTGLDQALYVVVAASSCDWSVTLTPR